MHVRIHRGTKEIGGNCIELESQGQHLLLDLGMPLTVAHPDQVDLPDVLGLDDGTDANFLGVVISHPHQDHYGLLPRAHNQTPVFIGKEAHALLEAAALFSPAGLHIKNVQYYKANQPFELGPFRLTPYLNDHSAFDAYSFLIEADGKTLFYSGDFRGHGRKDRAFEQLLTHGPREVDILLMEGTNLGRQGKTKESNTERHLESLIQARLTETQGLGLAWFSGQNIDRFVTFWKATKRARRTFVVDLYTAHIIDALGRRSLPSPGSSDLRVFLPTRMRNKIMREKSFDLVKPYYARRIYPEELKKTPGQFVMTFRPVMCQDLERADCLGQARLIYSLWPGYLTRGSTDIREWCRMQGVDFEIQHVSGHAGLIDMKRLVDSLSPKRLVPIHSMATDRFFGLLSSCSGGRGWNMVGRVKSRRIM